MTYATTAFQYKPAPLPEIDPEQAKEWTFTEHALKQCEERKFTVVECIAAAVAPHTRTHGRVSKGERTMIYRRGDCAVAVNPKEKVIVTVLDANRDSSFVVAAGGGRVATTDRFHPGRTEFPTLAVVAPEPVEAPVEKPKVELSPKVAKRLARTVAKLTGNGPARRKRAVKVEAVPVPMDWIRQVVAPALRAQPGRWARVLVAPDLVTAHEWAKELTATLGWEAVAQFMPPGNTGSYVYARAIG